MIVFLVTKVYIIPVPDPEMLLEVNRNPLLLFFFFCIYFIWQRLYDYFILVLNNVELIQQHLQQLD